MELENGNSNFFFFCCPWVFFFFFTVPDRVVGHLRQGNAVCELIELFEGCNGLGQQASVLG
jgi:hypothetical protein